MAVVGQPVELVAGTFPSSDAKKSSHGTARARGTRRASPSPTTRSLTPAANAPPRRVHEANRDGAGAAAAPAAPAAPAPAAEALLPNERAAEGGGVVDLSLILKLGIMIMLFNQGARCCCCWLGIPGTARQVVR
jgi:hypothetical protein